LDVAARGGKWKPDLLLVQSSLTPWVVEMMLVLPNPLFMLCFWFFNMLPDDSLISPGQMDITEGKKSMVDWHYAELVQAAERHKYDSPVSKAVLAQLRSVETSLFPHLVAAKSSSDGDGGGEGEQLSGTGENIASGARFAGGNNQAPKLSSVSYHNTDHMVALMDSLVVLDPSSFTLATTSGGKKTVRISCHPTVDEWWYWISRLFALLGSILLVAFLFFHDY
jgi:hypothetical protein